MSLPPFENEHQEAQEAASILLLRVALALLDEARLRADFGDEAAHAERVATLAAEFDDEAPPRPPWPSCISPAQSSAGGDSGHMKWVL